MSTAGNGNTSWLPHYDLLDHDQKAILLDDADVKKGQITLVSGPAGTGKTAIALYLCKTLTELNISYTMLTYHPLLVNYMRNACVDLRLDINAVTSLNSWIFDMYRKFINKEESNVHTPQIWRARAKSLRQYLQGNPPPDTAKRFILIDEVQDISEDQAYVIKALAHTVYATGDKAQAIASFSAKQELRRLWSATRAPQLLQNYRTTKKIAALASVFLDDSASAMAREDFVKHTRGKKYEEAIELFNVAGWINQIDYSCKVARNAALNSRRVAILLPSFEHVDRALQVPALKVLKPVRLSAKDGYKVSGTVFVTTVHSVKGMEFDHVILPSLTADVWDDLSQWGVQLERQTLDRLVFVAMTRARNWLTLITDPAKPASFVGRIRDHLGSATGSAPAPF